MHTVWYRPITATTAARGGAHGILGPYTTAGMGRPVLLSQRFHSDGRNQYGQHRPRVLALDADRTARADAWGERWRGRKLDEAKAAFRAAWERLLSPEKADEICSA